MRRDIEFRTDDGVVLRGWHYLPRSAGPTPTVVMSRRYSAVKKMHLDCFAEAFTEAGIGRLCSIIVTLRERRRTAAGGRPLAADSRLPGRNHLGQRSSRGRCGARRHLRLKLPRCPCARGRRDRQAGEVRCPGAADQRTRECTEADPRGFHRPGPDGMS